MTSIGRRVVTAVSATVALAMAMLAASDPASAAPLDGVADYLATRDGVVQVAVFDKTTGRTSSYIEGADIQYTASIQKVDILAGWLRTYQDDKVAIPTKIPYSTQYLMTQMIEASDNAAATGLFYFGGGCRAFTAFNRMIPMPHTTVGCQTPTYYGWGNTETTARDQVKLMKVFAYKTDAKATKAKGRPVLRKSARQYGLSLLTNIEAEQSWGVTCGPWGTTCDPPTYAPPDRAVTVAHKNGWKTLPTCTADIVDCPWQVNSVGWVKGQGRDYVIAVLTTDDPVGTGNLFGLNYGIDTIQGVSQLVWQNLAD